MHRQRLIGHSLIALTLVILGAAQSVAAPGPAASAPPGHERLQRSKRPPAAPVKLIDINSASKAVLKTLPGIGDAEADKIVAARPFLTKAELVTKGVIPTGPYLSLKTQVIAKQKRMPKARA